MSQYSIHPKKCYYENLRCPSCIMTSAAQIGRYQGMPWVNYGSRSYQTDYDDLYEGLSAELEDFYQFIRPKAEDDALRKATFLCIAKSIKKSVKFDIEAVKYYGSFSSNTYLPVSDIDMVVNVPKEHNVVAVLFEVAYLLFIDGIIEKHCSIIPHSRIPLLKFYDCLTGFQINITINTPNVMERAEYIRAAFYPNGCKMSKAALASGQYELKILYFMKYYLLYRGSNQVYFGGIGSYALSLMVLRYFQEAETAELIGRATNGALPGDDDDVSGDDHSGGPSSRSSSSSQSSLLGRLLIGFLQRYSDVDFISKVVISVRDGGAYIAAPPVVASQPHQHGLNISGSSAYSTESGAEHASSDHHQHQQRQQQQQQANNSNGGGGGMKQPPSHFAGHYLNKKCSVLRIEDPREPWKNVSAGSFNSDLILADFGRLLQALLNPKAMVAAPAVASASGGGVLHRLYEDGHQNQWSIIANGLTVVDSFVEYRAILKDIYSYWFNSSLHVPKQQQQQQPESPAPRPMTNNELYENFIQQRNIFGKRPIEFEYKRFDDNTAQLVLLDTPLPAAGGGGGVGRSGAQPSSHHGQQQQQQHPNQGHHGHHNHGHHHHHNHYHHHRHHQQYQQQPPPQHYQLNSSSSHSHSFSNDGGGGGGGGGGGHNGDHSQHSNGGKFQQQANGGHYHGHGQHYLSKKKVSTSSSWSMFRLADSSNSSSGGGGTSRQQWNHSHGRGSGNGGNVAGNVLNGGGGGGASNSDRKTRELKKILKIDFN